MYVVRSVDTPSFLLSTAKELTSSSYTTVSKSGTNIKEILNSGQKDSKGRSIQK
ncbi:hypothetical protein KHA80_12635 [Anaerobacillus sp. HL2]|nr:hypothetical protein KHA80_12635 [Anaerobacillus sp. HL2]